MSWSALAVDVEAVRLDADRDDVGAELPQRRRRHPIAGTLGAVDDDAQAFEREVARQRTLGEFDVAVVDAVDTLGAAKFAAFGQALGHIAVDQTFDLVLDLVRQLVAVRPEQLDTVIVEGIVRRRDHDAEIGPHRAGEHGHGGSRHRPKLQHVHADGGETGDQRGLDHVAGEPGILADHDAVAIVAGAAEDDAGRLSHLERQFRRDHAIGAAADPFSTVRASLGRRLGDERNDGVTDGGQAWLRWRSVDFFSPSRFFAIHPVMPVRPGEGRSYPGLLALGAGSGCRGSRCVFG